MIGVVVKRVVVVVVVMELWCMGTALWFRHGMLSNIVPVCSHGEVCATTIEGCWVIA